jgi:two-component system NtrC family sensor kinase
MNMSPFLIEALIERLSTPMILVSQEGQSLAGSPKGQQAWATWRLLAEPLPSQEHLTSEGWIANCLKFPGPSWLALEGAVVKCTAFPPGNSNPAGLLEWFPLSGPDSGRDKLRILQEVSQAVNSSLILEDIFEALGEVLRNHIPYQEAVIVILDDTQNGIKILVRMSEDGELIITGEHHAFAGYEPLMDRVLKEPFSHLYTRDALPETFLLTEDAVSALVVPLINKGVVIGLIAMSTSTEGSFYPYQEELLMEVSAQLAVAVENAKFYWQTQAQASREFLINQLTRSIRQSLDIDIILSTAVMELSKVMGISRCFIRYFDPNGEEEVFRYQLPGTPPLAVDQWDYEKSVFQLRRDQPYNPFILNDVRDCPPALASQASFQENDVKSLAIVPILIRDKLAGIITLHQCDAYRAWVMEDIELLRALAEHLGVALHQAQLFMELDQQKRALEQTLDELQQAQLYLIQSEKMAVLGQFVAGIAHEVNTPLGTMLSNNSTLMVCIDKMKQLPQPNAEPTGALSDSSAPQSDAPNLSAEQLFTNIDNLLSLNKLAGSRIQEIVKNLRNFARLDESEQKTVDVHEGIESTILLIQSSIDPRIVIERNYQPDLPKVQCFPGLLNQVFMNLLVNASHAIQDVKPEHRPPGSIPTITIETRFNAETDKMTIAIQDTGKGITPENLAKVFDPGFTTKGAGVGTGLGLALCYRIVEKHHGRISLESIVNEGARFLVEIPLRPPGKPA